MNSYYPHGICLRYGYNSPIYHFSNMDRTEFTTALAPQLCKLQSLLWPETVDHGYSLRQTRTLREPGILQKMSILSEGREGDDAISFFFQWDDNQFGSLGVHLGDATKHTPYRRAFTNGNRESHQRARKYWMDLVEEACKVSERLQRSCIIRDHPYGGETIASFTVCAA